jgi:hypothetical protein
LAVESHHSKVRNQHSIHTDGLRLIVALLFRRDTLIPALLILNFTCAERVYAVCQRVPPGKVTTYKAIADVLGCKSAIAVGQGDRLFMHSYILFAFSLGDTTALRRNPFPLFAYEPPYPSHMVRILSPDTHTSPNQASAHTCMLVILHRHQSPINPVGLHILIWSILAGTLSPGSC